MTNFGSYWQRVQKAMPVLVLISVVVTTVAFLFARQIGPTHQVHFSYLVSLSQRDESEDFRFDGFYALQATDLFSTTLAEWTKTPEVIIAAHREAGLAVKDEDPRGLARLVTASKAAPQLVQVTVKHKDKQAAEKLTDGLVVVMKQNVERYHEQAIPAVQFRVTTTEPWTGASQLSLPLIVVGTFVFTFFISLNILLLIESLKRL